MRTTVSYSRIAVSSLTLAAACALSGPAVAADDQDLFSTRIPPNVLLFVDNSVSMNAIMEHPSFVRDDFPFACDIIPAAASGSATVNDQDGNGTRQACGTSGCRFEINSSTAGFIQTPSTTDHEDNGWVVRRYCGRQVKLYHDGSIEDDRDRTIYYEEYLEWLFSLDPTDTTTLWGPTGEQKTAAQILSEIDLTSNGRRYIDGSYYPKFQQARIVAAREIARDVIYQTNSDCPAFLGDCGVYEDRVRFGLAQFHRSAHGGFVRADVEPYSANRLKLFAGINDLAGDTSTPLGETLFKLYTYFMSRVDSQRPLGKDGSTRFPKYVYHREDGDYETGTSNVPPDPVTEKCQKNFIIMITDGEPTSDTFGTSGSNTQGFSNFRNKLIGDYALDAVGDVDIGTDTTPEEGNPPWGSGGGAGYLDDIAKFIQDTDLRLDLDEKQTIDIYTVGFGTFGPVNKLLEKAADAGNGLFFEGNQTEELTKALVDSIADIIAKSQGFAAATVPAARTSEGGQLYTTSFKPAAERAFWPGELRSYTITKDGNVLAAGGVCAVGAGVDPADCKAGGFKDDTAAPPHWKAATAMPVPNSRKLLVSKLTGSPAAPIMAAFDHSLTDSELGIVAGERSLYPSHASVALDSDLDEAVVSYLAGCEWGTGLLAGGVGTPFASCTSRTQTIGGATVQDRLGDIFHSNPLVVASPASFLKDQGYDSFATTYAQRARVILAGANDGFMHGFDAGTWDATATPPGLTLGSGAELFGFMPWEARKRAKSIAKKNGVNHVYTADGSPAAADVWLDGDADDTNAKTASEWHTMLVAGMRQGGRQYYALDITNPASSGYPGYMWEFPAENDPNDITNSSSYLPYMGETWSEPIITKIKLKTSAANVIDRWVAIVSLGYDESGDPNHGSYSTLAFKGRGIAIIDLKTGKPIAMRRFGILTGEVPGMLYSIASTPAVLDYNLDGYADLIYVGDLGGNVWKWVVKDLGIADPTAAELYQPDWPFRKVFSDDSTLTGHRRSFFFPPSATIYRNDLYLAMGTGERADLLCDGSTGCTLKNKFFVFVDDNPFDVGLPTDVIDGREFPTGDLTNVTTFEDDCPAIRPEGYFFEVPIGRKFTTNSEIFGGFVFVSAFYPTSVTACDPTGESTLYGFLARCGQGYFGNQSTTSPIAGEKRTLDLGPGFATDPRLSIAPGDGGNRLIISKQDGDLINIDGGSSDQEHGQLYWRELDN